MKRFFIGAILSLVTLGASAQSMDFQEGSLSNVTRRTGGADYPIVLNQPAETVHLTLIAELADAGNSSHKIQLHGVSIETMYSGTISVAGGTGFLTETSKVSLTLNAPANDKITRILVKAESWRAYHSLYYGAEYSVGGSVQPDIDDQPQVDTEAEARARAEAEARARAEAEARARAEAEAREESQRQYVCQTELLSSRTETYNCITRNLRPLQADITDYEGQISSQERQIERLYEPIRSCEANLERKQRALSGLTSRFSTLRTRFNALKSDIAKAVTDHREAMTYDRAQYRCTLNVGQHRRIYIGEGPTKGKALFEAFKLCPRSRTGGCGKRDSLSPNSLECEQI